MQCEIVGIEESREVHTSRDFAGNITDLRPVQGSERAVLDLKLPGGTVIKASVSHEDFTKHVAPRLESER